MTHQILLTQRLFSEFLQFLLTQHLLLQHHQTFLLTQQHFADTTHFAESPDFF